MIDLNIMKILFITPYLPSAIRTRSYNFLKGLARKGHEIYLVCLRQVDNEMDETPELQKLGIKVDITPLSKVSPYINCLLTLPSQIPLQSAFCKSPAMINKVSDILASKNIDCVHVEHFRAAQYLDSFNSGIPMIFDAVDCFTSLYKQSILDVDGIFQKVIGMIEYLKLLKYEPLVLKSFAKVTVTSPIDKSQLNKNSPLSQISIIENGVDANKFRPFSAEQKYDLVFSGKMSYFANEHAVLYFVKTILPRIWRARPETTFCITGNAPSPRLLSLSKDRRITVTGFVDNMANVISSSKISVSPIIISAGIQNKVLEAMAMSKPLVTSSMAVKALSVTSGKQLMVADDPAEFAAAAVKLLDDRILAEQLGRQARQYVLKYHNWGDKVSHLELVYRQAIEDRKKGQK